MVKTYVKKPIPIQALQFTDNPEKIEELSAFIDNQDLVISYREPNNPKLIIRTLEGKLEASVNDYIIKGIDGEFYPCRLDIFEKTYEEVK